MTTAAPPPVVFLSYSHDSLAHAARVLALAESLRDAGIEAVLDQYTPVPKEGWPRWMENRLNAADFVLMVCTQTYHRRVMQQEEPGKGLGVLWEGNLIYNDLYLNPAQGDKYLPILLDKDGETCIPGPTRGHTHFLLQRFDLSDPQYEALYRHLTGQAGTPQRPLGTLVRLAPQPPVPSVVHRWNVPYARNPFFTGREDTLTTLHGALATADAVALSGLGGLGKTQTAVEYAYRHRGDYAAIFWGLAETETTLRGNYVEIARLLGLPEAQDAEQSRAVEAVKRWLETESGWLLVLDNAEDLAVVKPFLPRQGRGHVLLTTRAAALGIVAKTVRLDKLSPAQGALLLLRRARLIPEDADWDAADPADRAAVLSVAQDVDGLPLALDQAGAFIEETQSSPARYLELYRRQGGKLLAEYGERAERDHDSVAVTFSLAFEKIQASPAAADLLRVCALLAPDAIPETVFTQGGAVLGEPLAGAASDELEWEKTLREACRYSLLSRAAGTVSVHRLVQAVLRETMDAPTRRAWAERVVAAVGRTFPWSEFGNWPLCERFLPHALVCVRWVTDAGFSSKEAMRLLNVTAFSLDDRGDYAAAEPLYRQALDLSRRVLGPEHPDTATALNNLASLYKSQNRYADAWPLYQQALAVNEKALGPDHLSTGVSLNNLGSLLDDLGRYAEAEPLYARGLAIREAVLGPAHTDTAQSLSNLGMVYSSQGRYAEAAPLLERARTVRETALGPEHPDTALSLTNLASVYDCQGHFAEAEPLYARARAIYEKALGPDHPTTAQSLNNLGVLLKNLGRPAEAEPLLARALAIREKVLGPDNLNTAISLNNLAGLYQAQKRHAEAEPLYRRAVVVTEAVQGPAHPDTATALSNLAMVHSNLGRFAEAEPLAARALAIRETALGPDHPFTAVTLNNLASVYRDQGRYDDAEPLYQRALAIAAQALGPEHPYTRAFRQGYEALGRKRQGAG